MFFILKPLDELCDEHSKGYSMLSITACIQLLRDDYSAHTSKPMLPTSYNLRQKQACCNKYRLAQWQTFIELSGNIYVEAKTNFIWNWINRYTYLCRRTRSMITTYLQQRKNVVHFIIHFSYNNKTMMWMKNSILCNKSEMVGIVIQALELERHQ